MGTVLAIAVLVGLGVHECLRRIPSRSGSPEADAQVTVKGLCRGLSMTYETGIVRRRDDEVATGDGAFDGQFLVRGPEDLVRALLDGDVRMGLVALTVQPYELRDLVLEDGVLTAVARHPVNEREKAVLRRRMRRVAKALHDSGRIARRLAEAWHREGHLEARRLQLATLVRDHAHHPDTLAAVREAVAHADPEERLIAAVALGPVGREELKQLAFDASVDAPLAGRAIAALGEHFTTGDAAALLRAILKAADREAARVSVLLPCIAALHRSGSVEDVEPLLETAARYGDPLRRAARAAVAAIQSRATGGRGELSLPESGAGEVSLAVDGGELSLPPADKPSGD